MNEKIQNKQEIIENYLKVLHINTNIKTIDDITNLMKAHVSNFAFSSIKVLLKDEISLELNDIYEKVVEQKRGAYCFEHNKLFFEVLKTLNFDVEFYLARVVNNSEKEVPQTHRFTLLKFEGERYLIDVGIGFYTPCIPIKFGKEVTYSHLGISYKIQESKDNVFVLQRIKNDKIFNVTKFDLNPCFEADFEMGHFYSHKHPTAVFVNNLVISLITQNEIRSLKNGDYFKIYENSQEQINIKSLKHFQDILKEDFNLHFTNQETEYIYKNYTNI